MADESRLSQVGVEVAYGQTGSSRTTQVGVEVGYRKAIEADVSQIGVEYANVTPTGAAFVSQFGVELPMSAFEVPTVFTRPVGTSRRIRRLRQVPHVSDEQGWVFYSKFQLDLEAGRGLETGQGIDPQLMLQWSDDGGHTWSNEHWVSAGALGEYRRRAIWRRLGRSRDRVFRIVISDPVKVAWLDAFIDILKGQS